MVHIPIYHHSHFTGGDFFCKYYSIVFAMLTRIAAGLDRESVLCFFVLVVTTQLKRMVEIRSLMHAS